jgi:hypothetical protein
VITTIIQSRSVSRSAVAAGTISIVTTRIAPTDSKAVTAVIATAMSSSRESRAGEMPIDAEKPGSNVVALSSFQTSSTSARLSEQTAASSRIERATGRPATSTTSNGAKAISP